LIGETIIKPIGTISFVLRLVSRPWGRIIIVLIGRVVGAAVRWIARIILILVIRIITIPLIIILGVRVALVYHTR
jgi:hypothetical protein